tara:strand:+ start:426 stop:656 length:231 start_codon:yes stop_codon:yes gene_type:complete
MLGIRTNEAAQKISLNFLAIFRSRQVRQRLLFSHRHVFTCISAGSHMKYPVPEIELMVIHFKTMLSEWLNDCNGER